MSDKIPYFIQYNESTSITSTDVIYYDNNTNVAQAITYDNFQSSISDSVLGNEVTEQLKKLIDKNKLTIKYLKKIASHE